MQRFEPELVDAFGEEFHQIVEEGLAFVEGFDVDAFVAAVEADVVAVNEDPLNAVAGDTGDAEATAVGGTHDHVGNDRNAGPHF